MTELNTDYNNTELLDQELTDDQLQEVNGGVVPFVALAYAPALLGGIGAFFAGK